MLAAGQGVAQDPVAAVRWWRLAADQGHQEAQLHLGLAYAGGRGVPADKVEGLKWIIIARVRDGISYSLLTKLMDQRSIAEAEERAADWTRQNNRKRLRAALDAKHDLEKVRLLSALAEEGMAAAQFQLGRLYQSGIRDPSRGLFAEAKTDLEKAVELFRKAAEQGHVRAQAALAYALSEGQGTEKDLAKARQWYSKAAEQGYDEAQLALADMLEHGIGGPEDLAEARRLYWASAEQGNPFAMDSLGALIAANGRSASERRAAYMWLVLASKAFREEYMDRFARDAEEKRRQLAELMTEDEIERAKDAAARCLDSSYRDCR